MYSRRGKTPWNKGEKTPAAIRKKLSTARMGKDPWNKGKRGEYTFSEEIRKRVSASMQGISLEQWSGFKTKKVLRLRASGEYKRWRKAIFERDDYTCQICEARGGRGIKVILNADHIKPLSKYIELCFDLNNGRTLCVDCHRKTPTYGVNARHYENKS